MIVAEIKKRENIVEYIIYLKQIQDILRANNFDINKIDELIISRYDIKEKQKEEVREWYSNFIISMKQENIEENGDLKYISKLIDELNTIHLNLLSAEDDNKHLELYRWAKSNIAEYKKIVKINSDNEIGVCINALYTLLLLRLQKKDFSMETIEAMQTFSNLLAYISYLYHKTERIEGEKNENRAI